MTQPHDRRIHADALRRQHRGNQWSRFKRQAGIMLATVALGAVAVPYAMLDQGRIDALSAWSVARAKLWLASGTFADAEVSVRIGGQTYPGRSARAVIAHPYYRQSVEIAYVDAKRGAQFGFGAWLACLLLFRGAVRRRRERALRDRVIAGTLVTTEKKLAKLTAKETGDHAL
ncbi:MAG TPA: hypothetical protein VJ800_10110, partial [Pseudolabrys sp.]|nr:hypothetical protein [Pseudolabrys sp.]